MRFGYGRCWVNESGVHHTKTCEVSHKGASSVHLTNSQAAAHVTLANLWWMLHCARDLESGPDESSCSLITLQQDAEGFIRMNRHYPASVRIRINFQDGSTGEFSGQALNNAYDAALAEFRAKNNLDARGYSRTPAGRSNSGNRIDFVPVHPGMSGE